MMKNRGLIFRLLVVSLFLGFLLFGNFNKVSATNEGMVEDVFEFYHTLEEDLLIDETNTLGGFSDLFFEKQEKNVTLVIPDTVQRITKEAFVNRNEIVVVELPSSLPEIEAGAFKNCNRILEVYDGSASIVDPQMGSLQYGGLLYNAISFRQRDAQSNLIIESDGQVFCTANRGVMTNQNFFVGYLGTNSTLILADKSFDYEIYSYALWKNDIVVNINTSYSNASRIGSYAFSSCANLKYITLPDTLKVIEASAFLNSYQLIVAEITEERTLPKTLQAIGTHAFKNTGLSGKIQIPASVETIGEEAFYNCNIEELFFAEALETSTKNLTIEKNAFGNCTRLTVVELPTRLRKIYPYAFTGTGLSTIHIHSSLLEFITDSSLEEPVSYFPTTATIIFDSKNDYLVAIENRNLLEHVSQMTYSIPILFTDGFESFEMYRLANRDFDYVKGSDGIWSKVDYSLRPSLLPTQKDYKFSVWRCREEYLSKDFCSTKDEASVNEAIELISYMLQNAIRDGLEQIEFYAEHIEKPIVQGKTLVYNENVTYDNAVAWETLIENKEGNPVYDSASMYIYLVEGQDCISNAGDYTLCIQLKEEFGAWNQEVFVPIVVERKMLYLNNEISWSADIAGNKSNLLSGTVYIYKNAFGDCQYSYSPLKPEQIKKGYSFYSVLSVTNSIVRSRNFEVCVSLEDNAYFDSFYSGKNFTFEGTIEVIGQNQGLETNMYIAKAIIKAKPNYSFRSLGDIDSIMNSSKGLTIDISDDRTEARITKIWYILDVSNGIYHQDTKEEFNIYDWKYNSNMSLVLPELEYSNPTDIFTYSLRKDGVLLIEEAIVNHEERGLLYYINSSMPTGTYLLELHVPDVDLEGVHYFGYTASYTFSVLPADFKEEWKLDATTQLVDIEWQYVQSGSEGIVQVYHHSSYNSNHSESMNDHSVDLKVWSDFATESLNPLRQGYWATQEADDYYSSRFVLTYNLDRMQQNKYFSYDELQNSSSTFAPKLVGDYKVYYQLQAKNYVSLVDSSDDSARRKYFFVVTIFDYIAKPSLPNMMYTGLELKPTIENNAYFTVSYEDEDYSLAGIHSITLNLTDPLHYRWENHSTAESITIEFEILPAENEWIQSPNILSWEYGDFTAQNNLILAEAKYGTEIVFAVATDAKGEHRIAGLEEFSTLQGIVQDEEIIQLLKALPATNESEYYYLISMVRETNNYKSLQESTRFQIFKTKNTWKTTPNVMQWKYGNYDKSINLILAEASLKDENNPVIFTIAYDAKGENPVRGLESFITENGVVYEEQANILSTLKVNTYYLFARVKESQSYAGLNPEPYAFKVYKASNFWETVPTISSWTEGAYQVEENQIIANSHFSDDVHIVITLAGQEDKIIYDSKNGIDELAKAKCGFYELKAFVNGTESYDELRYTITFQIFEKPGMPWWGVLLIVLGALALVALVFFILHQSGVLQILSGKFIIAMRTKATVDATIAAVRANKIAEESKRSIDIAKQKELKELKNNRIVTERTSVKNERIKLNTERTDKFQKKAKQMQLKAERMIQKANKKNKIKFDDLNHK